jgi:hypothetical protein
MPEPSSNEANNQTGAAQMGLFEVDSIDYCMGRGKNSADYGPDIENISNSNKVGTMPSRRKSIPHRKHIPVSKMAELTTKTNNEMKRPEEMHPAEFHDIELEQPSPLHYYGLTNQKKLALQNTVMPAVGQSIYRLALDEAAAFEQGGKKDPWYQVIPCRYGQIYPYSDTLLAVHSKGSGIRRKLQAIEGLTVHNWSDDGEAIFLFEHALFNRVAEIVKPKRKRQLSDSHKAKLIESGTKALKAYKNSIVNAPKQAKNMPISAQAVIG